MVGAEARHMRPAGDTALVLEFQARHLFSRRPVAGCHLAAGFIFRAGALVEAAPYDPYLYFHGEEQSLSRLLDGDGLPGIHGLGRACGLDQ